MPILDLNTLLLFARLAFILRMPILLTYLSACALSMSTALPASSHQSPATIVYALRLAHRPTQQVYYRIAHGL